MLEDYIAALDREHPGLLGRLRGYAYFHDQSLDDLSWETEVTLWLPYGWFSEDWKDAKRKVYEKNAMAIAAEVVASLREHGLDAVWEGRFDRRIALTVNWQRRTLLPQPAGFRASSPH